MRFLVDECLPARLASTLVDADHVVGVGLGGAPDTEGMAKAAADNRVLISADTDFGELLANSADLAPSVILISPLVAARRRDGRRLARQS